MIIPTLSLIQVRNTTGTCYEYLQAINKDPDKSAFGNFQERLDVWN